MKKILILIILLLGCNNKIIDVQKIMEKNEHIIIDVRTNQEYEQSHIKGAINIPYDKIDDSLDKNKVIFVYCKSGQRSKIASEILTDFGYEVYDLGSFSSIDLPIE